MAPPLQLCWSSLRIHSGWFRALYAALLVPHSSVVSSPLWSPLHPKLSFPSFMWGLLRAFTKVSPARVVRPERLWHWRRRPTTASLWHWRRRPISASLLHSVRLKTQGHLDDTAKFGCQLGMGPVPLITLAVTFIQLLSWNCWRLRWVGLDLKTSLPLVPAPSGPRLKGQLSLIVVASLPAQTLAVILNFPVFFFVFFLLYFIFLSVLLVLFHRGPAWAFSAVMMP